MDVTPLGKRGARVKCLICDGTGEFDYVKDHTAGCKASGTCVGPPLCPELVSYPCDYCLGRGFISFDYWDRRLVTTLSYDPARVPEPLLFHELLGVWHKTIKIFGDTKIPTSNWALARRKYRLEYTIPPKVYVSAVAETNEEALDIMIGSCAESGFDPEDFTICGTKQLYVFEEDAALMDVNNNRTPSGLARDHEFWAEAIYYSKRVHDLNQERRDIGDKEMVL